MDAQQQALWAKLEAFEFDDPASPMPFSVRLARENGWSLRYAQRVLTEYRRFVFLATAGSHTVCPSEAVDAAWHLHLCYTRSYWHKLCRDTLDQPLHHEPTRGGTNQLEHHRSMYDQTLLTYRQCFGAVPPADIWPSTDERFAQGGRERHVNTAEHWIVRKPSLTAIKRSLQAHTKQWLLVAGVGLFPVVGAITNPLEMRGPEFLNFYCWIAVIAIAAGIVMRMLFRQADDGSTAPELDTYESATLASGADHAITVAVTDLALNNAVTLEKANAPRLLLSDGTPATHPLPQTIHQIVGAERNCSLGDARARAKPEANKIAARLENIGLLESNASFAAARWLPVLLMCGVLLLGLAKVGVGISREKPVLFLVLLCVGVLIALWKFCQRPHRTKRGDRVFKVVKNDYLDNIATLEAEDATAYQILGTSLLGVTAIATAGGLGAEVYQFLKPKVGSSFSSSSGCGTGCGGDSGCGGGGGCGGGCGGCGGD